MQYTQIGRDNSARSYLSNYWGPSQYITCGHCGTILQLRIGVTNGSAVRYREHDVNFIHHTAFDRFTKIRPTAPNRSYRVREERPASRSPGRHCGMLSHWMVDYESLSN